MTGGFDEIDAKRATAATPPAGPSPDQAVMQPQLTLLPLSAAPSAGARQARPTPEASEPPDHAGHRSRLKQRFLQAGPDALPEYELLEIVLFNAIPRKDTKPLAKKLLALFGTFAGVVNASDTRLREVEGVTDSVILQLRLVRAASLRLMKSTIMEKPLLASWRSVLDYCTAAMAHESREQFRLLFLDKKNRLIADEVQQTGTIDHTPVYVRDVVKRALELSASAIILVHNHPSGDATPSRADIDMTKQIVQAAKPLSIQVHDHLIIGRAGHASLKGLGLM